MTALHNKHVLVTGGAGGIGRLLALGCARVGAAVTIWDLDEEGAARVAMEASEAGAAAAHAFACDVSDREQVYARADEVRAAAGDVATCWSTTPASSPASRCWICRTSRSSAPSPSTRSRCSGRPRRSCRR